MNGLKKKSLLALGILSLLVIVATFTALSQAQALSNSSVHVAQAGDADAGTACSGNGDAQIGNCTSGTGAQSGDQSAPDNGTEPVGIED